MKKFMTLTMTAMMLVSLSACNSRSYGQRNDSVRRINYGAAQGQYNQGQGTARRMSINQNAPQVTTGEYRDGTFTGIGNRTAYGYETATVDIRSGRIVNVVLHRMDASGREIGYDMNTGNNLVGRQTGTTSGAGTSSGTGMSSGSTAGTATGTTTSGNTGRSNGYGTALSAEQRSMFDGITGINSGYAGRNDGAYNSERGKGLEDFGAGYARRMGNATGTPGGAAGSTSWGYDDNLTNYSLATQYGNNTPGKYGGDIYYGYNFNNGNTGYGSGYGNANTGTGSRTNYGIGNSNYGAGSSNYGAGSSNYGTGTNYSGYTGSGTAGTGSGYTGSGSTGSNSGYTGMGGGTAGSTTPNMMDSRTRLVNMVIQSQGTNVNIDAIGSSDTVLSWKMAIQRALDEARK